MAEDLRRDRIPVRGQFSTKFGNWTTCSERDYDDLMRHTWYWDRDGYITGRFEERRRVRLSRYLLNPPDELLVDHINGDIADNRRENLRIVTPMENTQNRAKQKKAASSKYMGVWFDKTKKYYAAAIAINKQTWSLGNFDTEEEAAVRRDIVIVQQKTMHRLAFPERRAEYEKEAPIKLERNRSSTGYMGVYTRNNVTFYPKSRNNKVLTKIDDGHPTAVEAAKAYDAYIVRNGFCKKLNFPEDHPDFNPSLPIRCTIEEFGDPTAVYLIVKSRPGLKPLIDRSDYDLIKHFHVAQNVKSGHISILDKDSAYPLHCFLVRGKITCGCHVVHINHKPDDNRRKNLSTENTCEKCKK